MKKLCLIICLNFLVTIWVFPQMEKMKPHNFTPDWEEFSIRNSEIFNGAYEYIHVKNIADKKAVRRYKSEAQNFRLLDENKDIYTSHNTYFFIFSAPRNSPSQTNKVYEFINYSEAKGETAKINGFQGKKYKFLGKDGFYHTILAIKSKNRSYIFQTTSELDKDPLSANFFAGIRLHSPNLPPKPDGKGYGSGSNSGNGSKACGGQITKSTVVYTPLIILSKPSPEYTDFARFYEIEGQVGIEVTYLENGELEPIKIINKLPFGLTEKALESAKQIKFNPPTADGRPYPTNGFEVYIFSLNTVKED